MTVPPLFGTAAETARFLGLTVEALRVYERHQLVRAQRTAAGWKPEIVHLTVVPGSIVLLGSETRMGHEPPVLLTFRFRESLLEFVLHWSDRPT